MLQRDGVINDEYEDKDSEEHNIDKNERLNLLNSINKNKNMAKHKDKNFVYKSSFTKDLSLIELMDENQLEKEYKKNLINEASKRLSSIKSKQNNVNKLVKKYSGIGKQCEDMISNLNDTNIESVNSMMIELRNDLSFFQTNYEKLKNVAD